MALRPPDSLRIGSAVYTVVFLAQIDPYHADRAIGSRWKRVLFALRSVVPLQDFRIVSKWRIIGFAHNIPPADRQRKFARTGADREQCDQRVALIGLQRLACLADDNPVGFGLIRTNTQLLRAQLYLNA